MEIIDKNTLMGCQHRSRELDSKTPFPSGHVSIHRQHCTSLNISDYMKSDINYRKKKHKFGSSYFLMFSNIL